MYENSGEISSVKSTCQVCGSDVDVRRLLFSNENACAACKKFFVRHCMSPVELVCLHLNRDGADCLTGCRLGDLQSSSFRRIPRLCSRCRFKKCLDIGMKIRITKSSLHEIPETKESLIPNKDDEKKAILPLRNNPDKQPLLKTPFRQECVAAELILTSMTKNISILDRLLTLSFEFDAKSQSIMEVWSGLNGITKITTKICSDFARSIPGFSQLSMPDRQLLFKTAYHPILLNVCIRPGSKTTPFFGLSTNSQSVMLSHVPSWKNLESHALKIAKAIAIWNPSFAEFALLEGILFYKCVPREKLTNPDVVDRYVRSLLLTLHSVMSTSDSQKCNLLRWSQLKEIIQLMRSLNQFIFEIYFQIASHPNVIIDSQLFVELFSQS